MSGGLDVHGVAEKESEDQESMVSVLDPDQRMCLNHASPWAKMGLKLTQHPLLRKDSDTGLPNRLLPDVACCCCLTLAMTVTLLGKRVRLVA